MQDYIVLAKKHKTIVLIAAFVLAHMLWFLAGLVFVGPHVSGIFAAAMSDMPREPLRGLQCPLAMLPGSQVVATAENPYDEPHRYTFYFDLIASDGQDRQKSHIVGCDQEIEIPPHQTADAACTLSPPDPGTDFVTVVAWAFSDVDRASGDWGYESSYTGLCTFPASLLTFLWRLTLLLLGSAAGLASLAWVVASWPTLNTLSRGILVVLGLLAWACLAAIASLLSTGLTLFFPIALIVYIALLAWWFSRTQQAT